MKRQSNLLSAVTLLSILGAGAFVIHSETPRGRLTGRIVTQENGSPLANVNVSLTKTDDSQHYDTLADERGEFSFVGVQAGWYHIYVDARAHEQNAQKVEVREGADTPLVWEMKPTAPFLSVFNHQSVYTTREPHQLEIHGFSPAEELACTTYRLSLRVATRAVSGAFLEALHVRTRLENVDLSTLPDLTKVSTVITPVRNRDAEGVFQEKPSLGTLSPGMYLLAFEAPPAKALTVITVSDFGIVAKASPSEMMAYAADIITGEPISGAQVDFLDRETVLATGVTGPDGIFKTARGAPMNGRHLNVISRHGNSVAVASIYGSQDENNGKAFTYTDRPVYRPGHTVYFKSIVRDMVGETYTVPNAQPARVRVVDRNDDIVYSGDFVTNAHGSFNGSFVLDKLALPGYYSVTVNTAGREHYASFMVVEYRKPEFVVKVDPEKERYSGDGTVRATVEAVYYYGAPVPNADVVWTVERSPSFEYESNPEWDEDITINPEGDYYFGDSVAEGRGRTDDAGRLTVSFSPPHEEPEVDAGMDFRYTIRATVTDESKFQADGQGSALVTQGDFRLEVSPAEYLAKPGKPVDIDVRAVDYDNKPVAGVSGTLEMKRRQWNRDGSVTTKKVTVAEFRTDAQGLATVKVTPPADGDYVLAATVRDSHRNQIRQAGDIFVMGRGSGDYGYPCWGVEVRAAKRLYREGESAEIVVHNRYPGQKALLTLEGADIAYSRTVQLPGKSNLIRVPITADCMPAINATITYIHNKQLVEGSAVLYTSRERKALRVDISTDKDVYEPGEEAAYRVKTLGPDGKPVSAEVSLGIVDEAVYSIREDQTPGMAAFFYPERLWTVRTSHSFPDVYLSGDEKAGTGIRTRRLFPDTAYWNPTTVTDANGTATFKVRWPDNLTTWRATCRAADMQTRVGQTRQKVVVRKPFLVRLEAPRFFIQGDEVEIAAVAHNLTGKAVRASIGLDCALAPVDGERNVVRNIDDGKTERIAWKVKPVSLGGLRIRVWGQAGEVNDAMELVLPVRARGREQLDARCGAIAGTKTENLLVRTDCVDGTQELTLRLSPSIASAMLTSLDYLAQYPYGCTEQTLSAFVPDIVLYRMLESKGIANPALRAKLPAMVREGLLKLYSLQHEDGGWRWWAYDDTDPWMTAYAVYGLLEAQSAGFEVNERILSGGINALVRMAADPKVKIDSDTRAYAAWVLTLAKKDEAASTALAITATTTSTKGLRLSDWGRPWLALAAAHLGRDASARLTLAPVWRRFTERGFQPVRAENGWRSDSEYAAALLYAMCELGPKAPELGTLARWLMDQRRGNRWDSTRDTAAVLYALSRYVALTGELNTDMTASITINGRRVLTRRVTAADMAKPEFQLRLGPKDLPKGPLNVTFKASGTGRLYYTASLSQIAALDLGAPLANDSGISISRRYRTVKRGENSGFARALAYERRSETGWRSGDIVEVTLVINARKAFDYLMVEDPLPAGAEVRDRGMIPQDEWGYWWAEQIARDQKVSFAIRHIEPGSRHIQYRFTATVPGQYTALPPSVFDMYNPAIRGEGAADAVRIK